MHIETVFDPELSLFLPHQQERPEGLHLSDIYTAMAKEFYPKWFKDYKEEEKELQVKHWEKGLILEEAWGDVFSQMVPTFARPTCKKKDNVWCSPDGYVISLPSDYQWPNVYPSLCTPSIHECKVTLKSCNNPDKSGMKKDYILHEKFMPWIWQVKGYCYVWECDTAYLHPFHILGDYGKKPWSPISVVHKISWTKGELAENWDKLMSYAKERGMLS